MKRSSRLVAFWALSLLFLSQSQAFQFSSLGFFGGRDAIDGLTYPQVPALPRGVTCQGFDKRRLQFSNDQAFQLKDAGRDGKKEMMLIFGRVTQVVKDRNSHAHFAIDLDMNSTGDVEVIYNKSFGDLPKIQKGQSVIACGEYIVAGPNSRQPSPFGAIIHWVHFNPGDRDGGKHPHGFLVIDGRPYGFEYTFN